MKYVQSIYCCQCAEKVAARLTNGSEVYPHRSDLFSLPFWICDQCKNFVGCHHKTNNPTRPLGVIPNKALSNARKHIHKILDPLWQSGRHDRKAIYAYIGEQTGKKYHTANIRSVEEAREIYSLIVKKYYAKKETAN